MDRRTKHHRAVVAGQGQVTTFSPFAPFAPPPGVGRLQRAQIVQIARYRGRAGDALLAPSLRGSAMQGLPYIL